MHISLFGKKRYLTRFRLWTGKGAGARLRYVSDIPFDDACKLAEHDYGRILTHLGPEDLQNTTLTVERPTDDQCEITLSNYLWGHRWRAMGPMASIFLNLTSSKDGGHTRVKASITIPSGPYLMLIAVSYAAGLCLFFSLPSLLESRLLVCLMILAIVVPGVLTSVPFIWTINRLFWKLTDALPDADLYWNKGRPRPW